MENKINNIIILLDSKKNKYPNLTFIWKNYLFNKIKLLKQDIDNCIKLFDNIEEETNSDINLITIILLLSLLNEIR